jgi:predicted transcriptional regulator
MSKGVGRTQVLLLRALASLEAQDGPGSFHVWAIADRCFELSQPLRARAAVEAEAHERDMAWWKDQAAAGNREAALFISLTNSLRRSRPSPRQRREVSYSNLEYRINPSRGLASLAARGLVERQGGQGRGSARLTDAGRDAARRALSVGFQCAETRSLPK